jgi:hypothetical protein
LNDTNKKEWIKNYIIKNQGCYKQQVVDAADKEGMASRKTVFNIIKELTEEITVREYKVKQNSKNIKLFIDEKNPAINIPKKINEIKNTFLGLHQEILKVYYAFESEVIDHNKLYVNLVAKYFSILQNLLDWISECYMKKSILIWPKEIKDSEVLKKIIGETILEIASIQAGFINSMIPINEIVKSQTFLFVKPNQSARTYYLSGDVNKFINEIKSTTAEKIYNSLIGRLLNQLLELVWEDNKKNCFEVFLSIDPSNPKSIDHIKRKCDFDPRECSWIKFNNFLEIAIIKEDLY